MSFAAAIVAGLLLVFAFPPLGLWPLSWLALAPLYVAAYAAGTRPVRGFWGAWVFGVVVFLAGAYWMLALGSVPWAMLAFIEALPFGIQAVYCTLVGPRLPRPLRPVLFAAVWVGGEWMRGWGRVAFPWFLLATAQVRAPLPMLQILIVTGQWGLSFAVALTGALLGEAFLAARDAKMAAPQSRRLATTTAAVAAAVPLAVYMFGLWPYAARTAEIANAKSEGATVAIAAIQGNIAKDDIGSESYITLAMRTYSGMTLEAARGIERPDLIVWPETAAPGRVLREPELYSQATALARTAATSLLIGTIDVDEHNRMFNTGLLFTSTGQLADRYDKLQIVPIGEYFPLRSILGPIYQQYGVPEHDIEAGDRPGLLTIPLSPNPRNHALSPTVTAQTTTRVGAMICYDDVFTTQARNRVRGGAEVLTLATSDSTFGTTAGPQQHADMDVLRAVETSRYLLRAAATGPSETVAPTGAIEAILPLDRQGILQRRVPLLHNQTLFVRWGDWFAWACVILAGGMGIWAGRRGRRGFAEPSS